MREEQQVLTPPKEEQERIKAACATNIWWFVNNYCWTYDPREKNANLPFDLFQRQEDFLTWLQERENAEEDGVAEKCRDVGFTWLCAAYALHGWLFRKGFKAGFGSRKLALVDRKGDPDSIFEKIRFLRDRLPKWMLPKGFNEREHDGLCKMINPANGATIIGEGGDNIGRGGRTTIYFVDEAAFLMRPAKIDAALSQNSRCKIHVSTPNGMGNTFAKKRFSGKFAVFTFRWQDDPRKDEAWYQKQKETLEPAVLAQEVDIDYTASVEGICIPAKWVLAAVNLELTPSVHRVAGLDISDSGKANCVYTSRKGPVIHRIVDWNHMNTTQTAWNAADEAEADQARVLAYDGVGVGAGVKGTYTSSERKPKFEPIAILSGGSPTDTVWPDGKSSKERFVNFRAEQYWKLRTRFEKAWEYKEKGIQHPHEEMISIPNDSRLIADLSLPLYFRTDTGKILIESKAAMAKRGVASPDFADSLMFSFAAEDAGGWEFLLEKLREVQGGLTISVREETREEHPWDTIGESASVRW